MSENVHVLPIQRKRGRRSVNPTPANAGATVLNFDSRGADAETAEQRLARIDEATTNLARAVLMAVRPTREIGAFARGITT